MVSPSMLTNVLFVAALVAAFYFLLIRPQQQQRRKHQQMVETMREGSRVLTIGGIYGTVLRIVGDDVVLEVGEGVEITVLQGAISRIIDETADDEAVEAVDHSEHDDPVVGEDGPDGKASA